MRNRALVSVFLIAAVSLSSTQLSSAATPKSGGSCTKLGKKVNSSGQTLVCVKSGKKLVWRKVATKPALKPSATPQPTPSSTATPSPSPSSTSTPSPSPSTTVTNTSFTPWSTDITEKELNDAAQTEFRKWAASRTSPSGKHELVIQSELSGQRKDIFRKVDVLQARLFSSYFEPRSVTVIGKDEAWVIKQLGDRGWNTDRCNEPYVQGVEICVYHDGGMHGYVIKSDAAYEPAYPGADGGNLLAHEYFHLVQWAASGTQNKNKSKNGDLASSNAFPSWMIEGSADFVGFSVLALAMNSTYWEGRPAMLTYSPPGYPVNSYAITDYEIRIGQQGDPVWIYPYHIGRVATEYIVASIGFQKFMEIWQDYKTTSNFETSFEKAAGISKEEFYKRFEIIRTKVGLPAATLAIVDGKSYPIGSKPSPSPSPSPTPTPTSFENLYEARKGISLAAWRNISETIKANKSKAGPIEIYTGPNTKPFYDDYTVPISLVSRAFPNRSEPNKTFILRFNFKDLNWAERVATEKIESNEFARLQSFDNNQFITNVCSTASSNCRGAKQQATRPELSFIIHGVDNSIDTFDPSSKYRLTTGMLEAHEYFHSLQRMPIMNRDVMDWPHAWFREGSSEWVMNAVVNYQTFESYKEFLVANCQDCSTFTVAYIQEFLESAYANSLPAKFNQWHNYSMGSLIIEALVALKGQDSIIEIYAQMGNRLTFNQAFKMVYGVEWSYAIPILAKTIHANLNGL